MVSVDQIVAYENGDLDATQIVELFADLVADGTAWTLQGMYGRTAASLIDSGVITSAGVVDYDRLDDLTMGA